MKSAENDRGAPRGAPGHFRDGFHVKFISLQIQSYLLFFLSAANAHPVPDIIASAAQGVIFVTSPVLRSFVLSAVRILCSRPLFPLFPPGFPSSGLLPPGFSSSEPLPPDTTSARSFAPSSDAALSTSFLGRIRIIVNRLRILKRLLKSLVAVICISGWFLLLLPPQLLL